MAKTTKKLIQIDGMTCGHCQARVEKALLAIEGVTAKVDLKKKIATVMFSEERPVTDDSLREAVEQAGYTVVAIEDKRGIFG